MVQTKSMSKQERKEYLDRLRSVMELKDIDFNPNFTMVKKGYISNHRGSIDIINSVKKGKSEMSIVVNDRNGKHTLMYNPDISNTGEINSELKKIKSLCGSESFKTMDYSTLFNEAYSLGNIKYSQYDHAPNMSIAKYRVFPDNDDNPKGLEADIGSFVLETENGHVCASLDRSNTLSVTVSKRGEDKKLDCIINALDSYGNYKCSSSQIKENMYTKTFSLRKQSELLNILLGIKEGKTQSDDNYRTSLIETLINNGMAENDALAISQHFKEVNEGALVDEKSKNIVYKVNDKDGNKKIIKFVANKEEAYAESLANYHLSRDQMLMHYVPSTDMAEPLEINTGVNTRYVTVQEDVSGKANHSLENQLHTKDGRRHYLESWMKILARLHTRGTQIMDSVGNYASARKITKEYDDIRIKDTGLNIDKALREDLKSKSLENGITYINQDLRSENRLGQYAIDWGHAGRGNPMLDIVKMLSDYKVQKTGLITEDETKHYLETYLSECNKVARRDADVKRSEIQSKMFELSGLKLLYSQSQSAYYLSKGDNLNINEKNTRDMMVNSISDLEKDFTKSLFTGCILETHKDDCIIYEFPSYTSHEKKAA